MSIQVESYKETWLCNSNNLSGFFCFFGSVIGFYGLKYSNKEYLKTVIKFMTYFIDLNGKCN
jgi:hypothetical protein